MGGNPGVRPPAGRDALFAGTLLADTNIFIRYLTGTPEDQFQRAQQLFTNRIELILTDVVVAEIVYVLGSVYQLGRRTICEKIRSVLAEPNIACTRKDVLLHATDLYEHLNLDWVDCYLIASTSIAKVTSVLSFDKEIDKIKGIRVEP